SGQRLHEAGAAQNLAPGVWKEFEVEFLGFGQLLIASGTTQEGQLDQEAEKCPQLQHHTNTSMDDSHLQAFSAPKSIHSTKLEYPDDSCNRARVSSAQPSMRSPRALNLRLRNHITTRTLQPRLTGEAAAGRHVQGN